MLKFRPLLDDGGGKLKGEFDHDAGSGGPFELFLYASDGVSGGTSREREMTISNSFIFI